MKEHRTRGRVSKDVHDIDGKLLFAKGCWVFGNLIWNNSNPFIIGDIMDEDTEYFSPEWWVRVEAETVGRFYGHPDKNGQGIYEGDIISIVMDDGETAICICEYGDVQREIYGNLVEITGFYFRRLLDDKKTFPIVSNYAGVHDRQLYEVIGDTYHNPELLKTGGNHEDT